MAQNESPIKLIVGLGNPGAEYAQTRHNVGAVFVDEWAQKSGKSLQTEAKFFALYAKIGATHALFPQTFMNASGRSVAAAANFFKIAAEEILVVHDELDLAVGAARYKKGGGHGGHNGLRDIISALGSPNFWRLRLGIGHPGDKKLVADWVLKRARLEEAIEIERAAAAAAATLPDVLTGNFAQAMRVLHTK